jgi:hypothetical protein
VRSVGDRFAAGAAASDKRTTNNMARRQLTDTEPELYRNVYPWNVPAAGYDLAGIQRPAGYAVDWRYVSEDGNWVAVSDPDPTPAVADQKWFFVPKWSLPTVCGGGANAKPPTTPERGPSGENWGLVCKTAAEGG